MNDPAFKTAAYILAEKTPQHLGQPTLPPQGWYLEGANLVVLLADGRKVRGPIIDQKRENIAPATKSQNPPWEPELVRHVNNPTPAKTVKPLPTHKPSSPLGKKK